MAIDRGPWNALVDDDGSNLTGTVWNKDKIKTVILDPTDAAIAAMPWTKLQITVAPGYQVNWNPGIVGHTILQLASSPAGAIEITGFAPAAPFIGQIIRVVHLAGSPATIIVHHENATSLAANQLHLRAPNVTIGGYWGVIDFQYIGPGWVQGVTASGQGALLVEDEP